MTMDRSWQFIGSTDGPWYRFYDWLRRGVNGRLVSFLHPFVADSARPRSQVCVLEAGSGTAFASSLLARQNRHHRCVCMDHDVETMTLARRQNPSLYPVVADLRQMPFANDVFHLVFNSSTVEHLDQPIDAVREMHRVVRPNGTVFVGVPYAFGPLCFQPAVRQTGIGVWLGTVFSRRRLDDLLRVSGLKPVKHMRYFFRFFIGAAATKSPTNTETLRC
jgi:SAM-dependent methyltransferase